MAFFTHYPFSWPQYIRANFGCGLNLAQRQSERLAGLREETQHSRRSLAEPLSNMNWASTITRSIVLRNHSLGRGPRIALLSRLKCHTPPKFAAIIPPSRSASFPLLDRPMRKGVRGRMGSRAQTYFAAAVVCREQHRTASRLAVFV